MRVTDCFKPGKPFFLGVVGGSGSGKTFFARAVQNQLGSEVCEIIYQDNFYIDQSKNFDFDGGSVNFDHPSSIEFSLLAQNMLELKNGQETQIPIYDFVTHTRRSETLKIKPKKIIIVDGILISHAEEVRYLFDEIIFFDTPEALRFQRRLDRDVKERGRDPEGVHNQFFKQVKPMHDQFVEPSKIHAHFLLKDIDDFKSILKTYCAKLKRKI